MKPLLLFLTLFFAIAYSFGSEEVSIHFKDAEIARSPGYARAVFDQIIKTGRKKLTSYRVGFKFQVNGVEYHVITAETDEAGAIAFLSPAEAQVAYNTKDPSINMMKRYYDLRHTHGTLSQSMVVVGVLATAISLPFTLILSWWFKWLGHRNFGWLRQRKRREP